MIFAPLLTYIQEGCISKCPILMFSVFRILRNIKLNLMVSEKLQFKRKICAEKKRIYNYGKDHSVRLNNHGRPGLLSFLSSLPISVLSNLEGRD